MGTSRIPLIITISDAVRQRQIVALQVHCLCGNRKTMPLLYAHLKFGPRTWLEALGRRHRCTHCARTKQYIGDLSLGISVTPLWRPRPDYWKRPDARPKLGPCE